MNQGTNRFFIESVELLKMIENHDDLTILDCRFNLQERNEGRELFEESHIPNAQYVDLEKDLSGEVQLHGGRHPLPSIGFLEKMFQEKGVSLETPVVIYDQGKAPVAARLFWILRFLGHSQVFVLQGGYNSWQHSNYPTEKGPAKKAQGNFTARINKEMLALFTDVKEMIETKKGNLIDSREYQRYLGNEEPIDKKAGRIPTALHYFWGDVFEGNRYKTKEQLMQHFQSLSPDEPITVYCGSGVTAAPNVLALLSLGFKHVKLYIGSFSDWISYDDSPVELGE
ncbi:thiosulfate/3-mercaptopyruvate sulfurtransferase [Bacillus oleivorans]|uniref:Thiosulfate/3-mercaptopyruvate sulfurtransferase n=1 Tax=Bacillus oleivorans TaxID=1448271 RepID=A0A285CKY0_9BACI|nr:sulfurtransferase [Bacillus oleivorans]SNX68212.1 thiosulfate/3-mercaptopyruvate sulfurtransferase [Bacillus oleivorans]